ncbi:thiamine phosphate synthase [Candidatus Woesearchaeota archaeon]|nr:thiamine phosphate synthase [Candidatus Woesearchaeota archaeon]
MREKSAKWQKLKSIDFYFITDSGLSKKGILSDAQEAINAGCKIIQYREKNKSQLQEALKLKKVCKKNGAIFLINDDVWLAVAADADGVHLGQEDADYLVARKMLGAKIIGLTVHNAEEAIEAEKIGADYVGLSPIFMTSTKKDAGRPCGISMIKKVRKNTSLPIVAVGGITKQNAAEVMQAGADSVAAISAVLPGNVRKEVSDFIRIIKNSRKKS